MLEKVLDKIVHSTAAERVMYYIGEFSSHTFHGRGDLAIHAGVGYGLFYLGKGLNKWLHINMNPYVAGAITSLGAEAVWEAVLDPRLPHTSTTTINTIQDAAAVVLGNSLAALTTYIVNRVKNRNS
jgi:hypothetical protein